MLKSLFYFLIWRLQPFSDVEKPFVFSELAAKAAKSKNKKRLSKVREGSDYDM